MKYYIKHMISSNCIQKVKETMDNMGLTYQSVKFGEVEMAGYLNREQLFQLKNSLASDGMELAEDGRSILVERIKRVLIQMIHEGEEIPKQNFSNYLTERLNYDYTYLSNVFSTATGVTIEHYVIYHKIERVKDMLMFKQFNLSGIAYKMGYSSVAHLSSQFKKITGFTPTFFKHLKLNENMPSARIDISKVGIV